MTTDRLREAAEEALSHLVVGSAGSDLDEHRAVTHAIETLRAALAEQKRHPLTDKQVANLLWEAEWPEQLLSDFIREKLVFLIRKTERAHGIGGDDGN